MSYFKTHAGNGKNGIPTKVVGKFKTNNLAKEPNVDIVIRTSGCYGHIMSGLPGKPNLFDAVPDWQRKGYHFIISDFDTVKALEDRGVILATCQMNPDLLQDSHARAIGFEGSVAQGKLVVTTTK